MYMLKNRNEGSLSTIWLTMIRFVIVAIVVYEFDFLSVLCFCFWLKTLWITNTHMRRPTRWTVNERLSLNAWDSLHSTLPTKFSNRILYQNGVSTHMWALSMCRCACIYLAAPYIERCVRAYAIHNIQRLAALVFFSISWAIKFEFYV